MINQLVIAGRLVSDPQIIESENNIKRTYVTVAVPRGYKNVDGEYETDFIRCILWNGIAENACEYCKKGDIIGVKGRLQTSRYEKEGETKYSMDVIAEKISFIASKKQEETE